VSARRRSPWPAISKPRPLIVLFDDNGISIDGPTSLSTSEDHKKRFAAAGWHVQAVDGHDPEAVTRAIRKGPSAARPT
jgi:transketolase